MHQVSQNCNFIKNLSSLDFKREAVGVAHITTCDGGDDAATDGFLL
jgi:hypothetical protein